MSTFDALCEKLSRNDPECTYIRDWRPYQAPEVLPDGYGPRLGQALRGNTCVECIDIKLERLLAKNEKGVYSVSSGNLVVEFLRQNPSLRYVQIAVNACARYDKGKNVKKMREVVQKAVMAVAENPHAKIALFLCNRLLGDNAVDVPPDTLARALRITKSISELTIALGDGGTPGWSNVDWEDSSVDRAYELFEDEDAEARGWPRERAAARTDLARAFGDNCSLKRLTLLEETEDSALEALWPELRRNGSIEAVKDYTSMGYYNRKGNVAKKYWTRNRRIATLLKSLSSATQTPRNDHLYAYDDHSISSADGYHEAESEYESDGREKAQQSPNPQRPLKIMPPVFAAVLETPRMAGSRVLQGLLAFNEDMGHFPNQDRKRAASEAASGTDIVNKASKSARGA